MRFLISMQWGQKLRLCIGRWYHGNWHSCISRLSSKLMQCCRQHFWSILIIQCIGVLSWFHPNQQPIYIISISAFKNIKFSTIKSYWDKRTLMCKTSTYYLKIHLNLFEIYYRALKFENLIKICIFFIPSENSFQT